MKDWQYAAAINRGRKQLKRDLMLVALVYAIFVIVYVAGFAFSFAHDASLNRAGAEAWQRETAALDRQFSALSGAPIINEECDPTP